jgi:hypothetical protein
MVGFFGRWPQTSMSSRLSLPEEDYTPRNDCEALTFIRIVLSWEEDCCRELY